MRRAVVDLKLRYRSESAWKLLVRVADQFGVVCSVDALKGALFGVSDIQLIPAVRDCITKSARLAVDTWTLVSTRLHLIKDMRIHVGKMIWDARFEALYVHPELVRLMNEQFELAMSLGQTGRPDLRVLNQEQKKTPLIIMEAVVSALGLRESSWTHTKRVVEAFANLKKKKSAEKSGRQETSEKNVKEKEEDEEDEEAIPEKKKVKQNHKKQKQKSQEPKDQGKHKKRK